MFKTAIGHRSMIVDNAWQAGFVGPCPAGHRELAIADSHALTRLDSKPPQVIRVQSKTLLEPQFTKTLHLGS
jgi:hypothetical protein